MSPVFTETFNGALVELIEIVRTIATYQAAIAAVEIEIVAMWIEGSIFLVSTAVQTPGVCVIAVEATGLQAWAKKYIAQSLWTDYAKTPRDATGRIREEWTVWCGTQESPTEIPFKAGTSKEEIRSWFKETFGLIPA